MKRLAGNSHCTTEHYLPAAPGPAAVTLGGIVNTAPGRARVRQGATKQPARQRGPAWRKIIALTLAVAALAAVWRYTPISQFITPERVAAWAHAVQQARWAPIAMILAYMPAAFLMFPRPLITLFGVVAFGTWPGFVYAMTGIILSALATYYTGRALPAGTVMRIAGERFEHMTGVLRRHGLMAIFAMRIVPLAPHPVENVIAGAARINVWHFTLGTFAGMLPGVLATTVFGDQMIVALHDPSKINVWLVAGIVLFFAALMYWVSRWFVRQTP